jgi:agmatinase
MEDPMDGLRQTLKQYKNEKVALLGLPTDKRSSFLPGPAQAPAPIRKALFSASRNVWTEAGIDLGAEGMLFDAGDVQFKADIDDVAEVETAAKTILASGARPIFLGGDHAVTFPIVKAVAEKHPGLTVLHFDAHPDLYDEYEGSKLSHACPFARIMEGKLAKRLVQIGIRAANGHQREQAERFGVETIAMSAVNAGLEFIVEAPVYVSFDMDVLDPAFAPGVSHWEPGGMSVRQAVDAIQSIGAQVVAADVVEFNPRRDTTGVTAFVAAKIVEELAGKMIAG